MPTVGSGTACESRTRAKKGTITEYESFHIDYGLLMHNFWVDGKMGKSDGGWVTNTCAGMVQTYHSIALNGICLPFVHTAQL